MWGFGSINGGPWRAVTVKPSSAQGKSVLMVENGEVISVQPSGEVQLRPAGTDNAYEQCVVGNGTARYATDGKSLWPFGLLEF